MDPELACEEPAVTKKSKPKPAATDRSDTIAKGVLNSLGRPNNMRKIVASNVYGTRWRVDVWCEIRPDVQLIQHSYFVVASEGGEILTASPPIKKLY